MNLLYLVSSSSHSYLVESHELFDYSDAAFRRRDMSAGHTILGENHKNIHGGYSNFSFKNYDIRFDRCNAFTKLSKIKCFRKRTGYHKI